MTPEDAEEYTQSLGQIFGGSWRQIAWAERQGIPAKLDLTTEQWVTQRLGGYVRLAASERRGAARELAEEGMSQRQIGAALGVSQPTVNRDLAPDSNESPQYPVPPEAQPEPENGLAGSAFDWDEPEPEPEPDSNESAPEPFTGVHNPVDETVPDKPDPEPPASPPQRIDIRDGGDSPNSAAHVGRNSGDNEWYTPAEYIKAAAAVMGGIDLDPASSEAANEVVGAGQFYTEDDNGLTQRWAGRVWMNPPYAQPWVDRFCTRVAREFAAGAIPEACVLVNNGTETNWFQEVAAQASAICFPRGRVKFWHPSKEATPLQGQAVLYLGPNAAGFRSEFLRFGFVVMR